MRKYGRATLWTTLGCLACFSVAVCGESAEREGTIVFEDSFERSELGEPWRILIPSFTIEEGRLVAHEVPERKHTSISRVLLDFRNAVFEFSFRITDAVGLHLVINDTNYEPAHSGHICRVSFSPSEVKISDDREGAFRKDLYRAYLDSGRTIERYLLQEVIPQSFDPERWYRARVVLNGERIEVLIDGQLMGSFESPGIGHPTKTDFGFVTKGNLVEIDDVRVTKFGEG